ncbi:MAG: hypothetical protein LBU14_02980 [Candidatus Peribacteria bacterium]|jgi:exonuclease VII large subunit|nr:hypothetical protein [Candidatus Peribacteria bacterium]
MITKKKTIKKAYVTLKDPKAKIDFTITTKENKKRKIKGKRIFIYM